MKPVRPKCPPCRFLRSGLADMYLIYVFAKDLFPDKYINIKHWTLDIKHLASLMLAVSPFHIYYSQEFRMYSLLSFLGTLSIYLLYRKKYLTLGLVNALMLYTHYSGIFLIFAQTVYVLFYARKHAKNLAVSHLLIIVIFLPWLAQFFRQLGSGLNIDHYLPGWRNVLSISPLKAFPVIIFKIIAGRISFISRYLYGIYITFVFFVTFASLYLGYCPCIFTPLDIVAAAPESAFPGHLYSPCLCFTHGPGLPALSASIHSLDFLYLPGCGYRLFHAPPSPKRTVATGYGIFTNPAGTRTYQILLRVCSHRLVCSRTFRISGSFFLSGRILFRRGTA